MKFAELKAKVQAKRLDDLTDRLKAAKTADSELIFEVFGVMKGEVPADHEPWDPIIDEWWRIKNLVDVGAYIDAAMLLLPSSAVHIDLFSHTINGGQPYWSVKFMDTEQTMGPLAATQEIARMRKAIGDQNALRGEIEIKMEKAIASHYLEFHGGATTAALALCVAAINSKRGIDAQGKY